MADKKTPEEMTLDEVDTEIASLREQMDQLKKSLTSLARLRRSKETDYKARLRFAELTQPEKLILAQLLESEGVLTRERNDQT